jgi:hypothetical protein
MTEKERHRKGLSRFGIVSVFLSIIGLGMFAYFFNKPNPLLIYLSIVPGCAGIVLAIAGLVSISKNPDKLRGLIYCFAAILIFMPCLAFVGVSEICVQTRRYVEQTYTGIPKLHILSYALKSYADNHNGLLPDANSWCDDLLKNDPNLTRESFKNPDPKMGSAECGFAFNENLSGKPIADIPKKVVLLFEASGKWNLSGSQDLLDRQKDKSKYIKISLVDTNMADYWFYAGGVREEGAYHRPIQWSP